MRINRTALGMLAVAGLAFVAGRIDWGFGGSAALAQQTGEMEMPPEMEALMKAGTPGKHHKHLEQLIGEWQGVVRMWFEPGGGPMEATCRVTRKWVLDGRFVKEVVESDSPMGTFKGLAYWGYNNIDGQYEMIWMENHSTAISFSTAYYDPDQKAMFFEGSRRNPLTGQVIKESGRLDLSSPGRQTYVGYQVGPDGKKFKNFEGEFDRVK